MLRSISTSRRAASSCSRTLYIASSDPLGIRNDIDMPPRMPKPPSNDDEALTDHEWNLRTGRAVDLIHKTLPSFFQTGLVTSIEKATGHPCTTSPIPIPVVNANPLGRHPELEPVYSPHVRLSYTPPVQLPAPFPKTLHIEGFPMYIASSAFARHTLSALYSDLRLVLEKFVLEDPPVTNAANSETPHTKGKPHREKSLTVVFSAHGNARVSGTEGRWDVHSTYTFSPVSGLIHIHTVNSILPAPHQAVYDSLRTSLGAVFSHPPENRGAACVDKTRKERRS